MKRQELKSRVEAITKRIDQFIPKPSDQLPTTFQQLATDRDKLVVDGEKFKAEMTHFLTKIELLPEEHDDLLAGHYRSLQRQLEQYEKRIKEKEVYWTEVTRLRGRKIQDLLQEINTYLSLVIAEIKQEVELSHSLYGSDTELKRKLSTLQAYQVKFNGASKKSTEQLGQYVRNKKEKEIIACLDSFDRDLIAYRDYKNEVEERLFTLESRSLLVDQYKNERDKLLAQCQKLVKAEIEGRQWKPEAGFELPNHHVEISTKKYFSGKPKIDLVDEYEGAKKEYQSDIFKLEAEIKAITERYKTLVKAHAECTKLLKELDEEIKEKFEEKLEYKNEYLLDSEFQKNLATIQEKRENYALVREKAVELLKKYFITHDTNLFETSMATLRTYLEAHTSRDKVVARYQELVPSSMTFHNIEGKRNVLLDKYEKLIDQFKRQQWAPYQLLSRQQVKNYLDFKQPVDLLVKYKEAASECEADIILLEQDIERLEEDLKLIEAEKAKQDNAKNLLKATREQATLPETYLDTIKSNHKKYLEKNMVTYLKLLADSDQVGIVQKYTEEMQSYHETKEGYLKSAIESASLSTKLGGGALAALLGIAGGGGAFFASKSNSILGEIINPLKGAFSGLLGAGISVQVYNAWLDSHQGQATVSFDTFKKEMEKAGFTDKKYEELSEGVVKLFHFRECVLLGLKDTTGTDMRDEFKKQLETTAVVNENVLNLAIEVHFLEQLNQLFNKAFKAIYTIQDEAIEKEKGRSQVVTWLVDYFKDPKKRQNFTQQLQIAFMDECLNYLKSEMNEPGFIGKHPYLITSVTGLMGGAIALGVAAVVLGGSVGLGVMGIALVVASMSALVAYLVATQVESFNRSKENRVAIQQAIDMISTEKNRLDLAMKNVTETSTDDLQQLQKYEGINDMNLSTFFGFTEQKNVAMGVGLAWLREYASRYRHSKFVEIELAGAHQEVIAAADKQTKEMQDSLVAMMSSNNVHPQFAQFIQDTRAYLTSEGNKAFIEKFDLVKKIKEQILHIVAAVPLDSKRKLPKELIAFYTEDLGGSVQDLIEVRKVVSTIEESKEIGKDHPYKRAASRLKDEGNILGGDDNYREMLGLRIREEKIDENNIDQFLTNSYEFLLSLLDYEKEKQPEFDKEYRHSDEFTLYKTLLIKQLANLADPNNQSTSAIVRRKVEKFAEKTLGINPKIVFNQVINQGLLHQEAQPKSQHLADAIVVGLAYDLKKLTPKALVEEELQYFLAGRGDETKLFYGKSRQKLRPEVTEKYAQAVSDAIAHTKDFIAQMKPSSILVKSHALEIYLSGTMQEIDDLLLQIKDLRNTTEAEVLPLDRAETALRAYKNELLLEQFVDDVQKYVAETEKRRSALHYSQGEKKAAAELLTALQSLKADPNRKVALSEGIPAKSGGLLSIVNKNLDKMGYKEIGELIKPPSSIAFQGRCMSQSK